MGFHRTVVLVVSLLLLLISCSTNVVKGIAVDPSLPYTYSVQFTEDSIPAGLLSRFPLTPSDSVAASGLGGLYGRLPAADHASVSRGGEWQWVRLANQSTYACFIPGPDVVSSLTSDSQNNEQQSMDGNPSNEHDLNPQEDAAASQGPKRGQNMPKFLQAGLRRRMNKAPCATMTHEWWTYELCWDRHVRQYHLLPGGDTQQVEKEYYLGKGPLMHIEDGSGFDVVYHEHPSYGPFVSSVYYNGTDCEVGGFQRQTEVRLYCSKGAPELLAESITVTEPRTCQYLVSWWTQHACVDGLVKPQARHFEITCYAQQQQQQEEVYRRP